MVKVDDITLKKLADTYQDFMSLLGIPVDPNSEGTAMRVARMMYNEKCAALRSSPPKITTFPNEGVDQYVVIKDIPYFSICFAGSTFVRTPKGHKRIADVVVGDEVATLKDGVVVWTTVEDTGSRKVDYLLHVKTKRTHFKLTKEHPIFTSRGWIDAGELMLGDKVAYVNNRWFTGKFEKAKVEPSYALGYFLGCLLSDGYVSGRETGMKVTEKWFADKFASSIKEVFGREVSAKPCKGFSSFRGEDIDMYAVRVVSRHISKVVAQLTHDRNKCMTHKVPEIAKTSKECMQGFLDGYMDGDGCRCGNSGGRSIVTANKAFAEELSEIVSTGAVGEQVGKFGVQYRVYVPEKWDLPIYGRKGFVPSEYDFQQQDFEWDTVESIDLIQKSGHKFFEVYNLTCAPYDTYLANGVLAHNCAHHHVSFSGVAHIVYHPGKRIAGLSKFARVVKYFAAKPQIQEALTTEIAKYLFEQLEPVGIAVRLEGRHLCMEERGIQAVGAKTVTQKFLGQMDKDEVASLIGGKCSR